MARRNQNTFLKRQKEIERMRKAKEKMDRRQGKVKKEEEDPFGMPPGESAEGGSPEDQPSGDQPSGDQPSGEADADGTSPAPESDEEQDDKDTSAV